MIYCSRMLYTSALFVTVLGGLPRMMPGSLEMLSLDWNNFVESYHLLWNGPQQRHELDELDDLVLHNTIEKQRLVVQLFEGNSNLLQTAQLFRRLDQKIQPLAQLRRDWSDGRYCQEVIGWARSILRQDKDHWDPTLFQQLETQLNYLSSPSEIDSFNPGLDAVPEAGQGEDLGGLDGDRRKVVAGPAHLSVPAIAGLVRL